MYRRIVQIRPAVFAVARLYQHNRVPACLYTGKHCQARTVAKYCCYYEDKTCKFVPLIAEIQLEKDSRTSGSRGHRIVTTPPNGFSDCSPVITTRFLQRRKVQLALAI